jgi:hypothetical protein
MLTFDESTHIYQLNNKPVVSVTQIYSRIGIRKSENDRWVSLSGMDFLRDDTAAKFGTAFHKAAELIINEIPCVYDPALEPWICGLKKFIDDYKLISFHDLSRSTEIKLASNLYLFAGTFDWLAVDASKNIYLIDWKTATAFNVKWREQTAAYEQLIKENRIVDSRKNVNRLSVRVFENGYEVDKRTSKDRSDFNKFLSVLNVYKQYSKGL